VQGTFYCLFYYCPVKTCIIIKWIDFIANQILKLQKNRNDKLGTGLQKMALRKQNSGRREGIVAELTLIILISQQTIRFIHS
jgi:hypothetical protein